jgi:hypothetical protein
MGMLLRRYNKPKVEAEKSKMVEKKEPKKTKKSIKKKGD